MIDAYIRIAVIGIELITIDARIAIASVDTIVLIPRAREARKGKSPGTEVELLGATGWTALGSLINSLGADAAM